MKRYYRIVGKYETILLTRHEYKLALDRENEGVVGIIIDSKDYERLIDKLLKGTK
jgi:hypothetical protein